GLSLSFAPK
nr:RecName: Full=Unknown protein 1 [Ginkgo biloba]